MKLCIRKDSVCDKAAAERMPILHWSCSLANISTLTQLWVCACVYVCMLVYEWEGRMLTADSAVFPTHTHQTISGQIKIKNQQVQRSNGFTPPLCNMLIYWSYQTQCVLTINMTGVILALLYSSLNLPAWEKQWQSTWVRGGGWIAVGCGGLVPVNLTESDTHFHWQTEISTGPSEGVMG